MDKLRQAISFAVEQYQEEFGKDVILEDGEEFATVFNDGILIIGMENKTLKLKVLAGKPYFVDYDLNTKHPKSKK